MAGGWIGLEGFEGFWGLVSLLVGDTAPRGCGDTYAGPGQGADLFVGQVRRRVEESLG